MAWRPTSPEPRAQGQYRLLSQAKALSVVSDAWNVLEVLRPGGIYGKQPDRDAGIKAQEALKVIKDWAEGVRPHP